VDPVKSAPLDVEELPAPRAPQGRITAVDVTGKPRDPGEGEELQPQRLLARRVVDPVVGDSDAVKTRLVHVAVDRSRALPIARHSKTVRFKIRSIFSIL
jgi:hypothetical protein